MRIRRLIKRLTLALVVSMLLGCGIKVEDVQSRMEEALYSKYGEEFVVENIGLREANGQKFYQARIYPKSILGTEKENDSYYYASASIDLVSPNRLSDGVGDSYSFINRNDDVEKYLEPKIKEIFGERTRVKVDVKHEVTGDGSWWAGYKSSSLQEMREAVKVDPERERIVLELYVYIFDRIDSEKEKEERREQIFEFIQYLKVEGLFKYTRIYMTIADERVLTNSYRKYRRKQDYVKTEVLKVGDLTFNVPNLEFRKEMTKVLSNELNEMREEELIKNMSKIKKNEIGGLARDGIIGNSLQYHQRIESKGFLQINDNYDRLNNIEKERVNYKNKEDISLIYIDRYIFVE